MRTDYKRRTIERDYEFYDPPDIIWKKVASKHIPYQYNRHFKNLRDLSLLCLLYLSSSRIGEIARIKIWDRVLKKRTSRYLPSVNTDQFRDSSNFLYLRGLRIVKRTVASMFSYPIRKEIELPKQGYISRFTKPILDYINILGENRELFPFSRQTGYSICNKITGETEHYLREMGLKWRFRIYKRDLVRLQTFSGHARIENLMKYLKEPMDEEAERLLTWEP